MPTRQSKPGPLSLMKSRIIPSAIFIACICLAFFAIPNISYAALVRPLIQGDSGPDVKQLQLFLNSAGSGISPIAASGPGSPGSETTLFGSLTTRAVQAFQCKHGLVCSGTAADGYGRVGPRTMALVNSLMGNGRVLDASTDGPIAHYAFDGNANDSSGNGNTGTAVGNGYAAGKHGQAIMFNAANQYVDIPDVIEGLTSMTAAAWVQASDLSGNPHEIFSQSGSGRDPIRLVFAAGTSGNDFQYRCSVDNGVSTASADSASQYKDTNWHHVACVYDGVGGRVRLYVDGVEVDATPGVLTGPLAASTNNLIIGSSDSAYTWAGLIDDARLYSVALSSSDIATLYSAGGVSAPASVPASVPTGSQSGSAPSGNVAVPTVPVTAPVPVAPAPVQVYQSAKAWSYPGVPYTDWAYDPFTHAAPARPAEWPGAAKQDYYFVAPNDANATDAVTAGEPVDANGKRFGYPNKPRLTLPLISKNFNSFPAGTVFWMKGGEYNTVYGTGEVFSLSSRSVADKPFWIYGDPSDKPVFRNARILIYNSSYGFVENIVFDDGTKGSGTMSFGRSDAEGDTHHIAVRNIDIKNRRYTAHGGLISVDAPGATVVNGDIHDMVFYKIRFKNNGGGVNWNTVDADMHGYKLNGDWNQNRAYRIWVIENDVRKGDVPDPIDGFYKSVAGNFMQVGDQSVQQGNVDHVWIAGNYSEGSRQGCIGFKRSGHAVASSNVCKDLAQAGTSQGQAFNIKYDRQENLWFVNNYVENVDSFIIRAETTSSGAGGPDTFSPINTRVHIIGNVFKNNMRQPWNAPDMGGIGGWKTKGISIQDMNGKVYIANNVIDTSVYGVYFDPHSNRQSAGSEMHVYNNIAVNLSAGLDTSTAANNGIMITTDTASEWFIENNLVDSGRFYYSGTQYNSAAAFNARVNASGNMQGDPMFANPNAGDYTLRAGSPAIDAGIRNYTTNGSPDVYQLFINAFANDPDFPGNPADVWPRDRNNNSRVLGSNIDMGAYERGQSGSQTTSQAAVTTVPNVFSDSLAPSLSQVTPVSVQTSDATPSYTFASTEAGTIAYGGSCSSANTIAVSGNNTITFRALSNGRYSNCTVTVIDASSNASAPLAVTAFTIDTTSPDVVPPIISSIASSTAQTTATIAWTTNESAVSTVDYGPTASYGSASSSAALTTTRSIALSGLIPLTTYHFRVSSIDDSGNLSASTDLTFTTAAILVTAPTVTAGAASAITTGSVVLTGAITADNGGSSTVRGFEYGLTTSYGQSVSTTGSYGTASYSQALANLTPGTLYHYRAFATNGAGTGVSTDGTFTTVAVPVYGGSGGGGSSGGGGVITYGNGVNASASAVICAPGQIFSPMTGQRCAAFGSANSAERSQYAFARNLTVGSRGEDVRQLQIFLNSGGFKVAASGPGSPGKETLIFGPATRAALARYQASKNIRPSIGYFGPATRASASGNQSAMSQQVTNAANAPADNAPISAGSALKLGSTGAAVKLLRQKLRVLGYFAAYGSASDVPASAAAETDYFGPTTEIALKKFQCDKGIVCAGPSVTTGWGSVGPKTRTILGL